MDTGTLSDSTITYSGESVFGTVLPEAIEKTRETILREMDVMDEHILMLSAYHVQLGHFDANWHWYFEGKLELEDLLFRRLLLEVHLFLLQGVNFTTSGNLIDISVIARESEPEQNLHYTDNIESADLHHQSFYWQGISQLCFQIVRHISLNLVDGFRPFNDDRSLFYDELTVRKLLIERLVLQTKLFFFGRYERFGEPAPSDSPLAPYPYPF